MQTKLTKEEIGKLKQARNGIENGVVWDETDEGHNYWQKVSELLDAKIKHGTSDGKPWVDPEPPIPDGWRRAEADEWTRRDVKFWLRNVHEVAGWQFRPSQGKPFDRAEIGTLYIVPIEPPLTDQDACVWPRLKVMVRDHDEQEWQGPYRYFGKDDIYPYPYIVDSDGDHSRVWKQARRATPAEIEAAK